MPSNLLQLQDIVKQKILKKSTQVFNLKNLILVKLCSHQLVVKPDVFDVFNSHLQIIRVH